MRQSLETIESLGLAISNVLARQLEGEVAEKFGRALHAASLSGRVNLPRQVSQARETAPEPGYRSQSSSSGWAAISSKAQWQTASGFAPVSPRLSVIDCCVSVLIQSRMTSRLLTTGLRAALMM